MPRVPPLGAQAERPGASACAEELPAASPLRVAVGAEVAPVRAFAVPMRSRSPAPMAGLSRSTCAGSGAGA